MGTRRGNGEGTLYRTRDGRWRGQASLAGRRPGVSGRTRAEAARKLLQVAAGDRLEALFVLALTTGMRQGELLGLRWADVDLEAGLVRVRRLC